MQFTKKQIRKLKNCHPEADDDQLIAELELRYAVGIPFKTLKKRLKWQLETRKTLPWIVKNKTLPVRD